MLTQNLYAVSCVPRFLHPPQPVFVTGTGVIEAEDGEDHHLAHIRQLLEFGSPFLQHIQIHLLPGANRADLERRSSLPIFVTLEEIP